MSKWRNEGSQEHTEGVRKAGKKDRTNYSRQGRRKVWRIKDGYVTVY